MQHATRWLSIATCLYSAVVHAGISLDAPNEVPAGAGVVIEYSGDVGKRDFITIVPIGEAEGKYADYKYTHSAQVELLAPEDAGSYEIRDLDAKPPFAIRARQALTVTPVEASVDAPRQVDAGERFSVTWTGPDNAGDWVAITEVGADKRSPAGGKWAYTRHGSPAELHAPFAPGDYEIRYQMGQSDTILATRPLHVTPPPIPPGHLIVSLDPRAVGFTAGDAVEIILDASETLTKSGVDVRVNIGGLNKEPCWCKTVLAPPTPCQCARWLCDGLKTHQACGVAVAIAQ